ncbi:Alpha/Beta hydrolase protein [Armillaria luteobubalina]|uniref:Alpha/Beta hydrolase protein n=1 Tax=Armillaria luteobubalina TaxID=153913 RepID=A0AA39QC09_9AGAR|nr:Alpha/Beta hydrolase protein [Armillaria luteobubalina]
MAVKGRLNRLLQSLSLRTTKISASIPMSSGTLVVNTAGVELAYLDSGAPADASSYTTIFAVHGMIFTNLVFQKVLDVARSKGVRFVAIQRRPFPGSTPFTAEELNVVLTGGSSEADRDAQITARGHEIASFVDAFIQKFKLPALSDDGKTGGVALLGWSVGGAFPLAAVASSGTLPADVQARFSSYLRSLIVYESAPLVLGLPTPTQNWVPLIDTTIPENLRLEAFGQWCTGYFDQGDITLSSPHNLDSLSWVISSPKRVPTFYSIPVEQHNTMTTYGNDASTDLPFLFFFSKQLNDVYSKAFNDKDITAKFPRMKKSFLCGDKTAAFGVAGLWAVQDDQKENGTDPNVKFKLIPGANHFLVWDDPEKAFDAFMDLI